MGGLGRRYPPRPAFTGLWRDADVLKLWGGQTVSLFRSHVTTLALPLVAVLQLHATPAQMSLLSAARFAPFLLITLFAGVWVVRHPRRLIVIDADLGRAPLISLVPLMAALGQLRIEHLYLVASLVGVLTVVFGRAYQSYLPSLAAAQQLVERNSTRQVCASAAEIGAQRPAEACTPNVFRTAINALTVPYVARGPGA